MNRDVRQWTEDRGHRTGDKERRRKTVGRGRETWNRHVRQGAQRTGDKERRRKTCRGQRTGNNNRDVRQWTEDGRQGTET